MHQNNFYLLVEPNTCVAAWTAIDDADPENGGMYLVSDTADEEIFCPQLANKDESSTTHFVPTPKGKKALPCKMKAGDTLFFNGSSIYGSGPNRSKDRFRRSFICHYVPKSTQPSPSRFGTWMSRPTPPPRHRCRRDAIWPGVADTSSGNK
ncbi:MAG: phytanoyl-CoA dioxygenase family protein [Spartobacteria bacterium]